MGDDEVPNEAPERSDVRDTEDATRRGDPKGSMRIEATDAAGAGSNGRPDPTVVGIGASAGGLAALKTFFAHVPEKSGLAFVVVVHLSPEHESHLAELLQPHTSMPVEQVAKTLRLEADRVYVIPPNSNLSTIDTHLRLSELEERRRERAPIDHFFRTMAKTHDGHAIGVVLTGTGADGTLGIKEIKEKGGLTIVQSPSEAEYDGMPKSAIATGLVDQILPLAEIPDAILKFASTEPRLSVPGESEDLEVDQRRLIQKIFARIRARTGRDFSRYKPSTILRRIQRRMQIHQIEELEQYLDKLRDDSAEVQALADDFLITVTNFFRDREVFEELEKEVIPRLFEGKGPDDDIRVWSVGCATGEEAYSLSMLLLEEAARRKEPPQIHVFGSDLHERSLVMAREGLFSGDIEADVSRKRLHRFFQKDNGVFRIRKEVRDLVVFAPHNLLGDPPFSRQDLISCRNLMIYLQRDVQRDVMELFHYALKPDGMLMLGSSETISGSDLFRTANKKLCLYQKRNVPGPEPRLPVFPVMRSRFEDVPQRRAGSDERIAYGSLHQKMVEQYAPPSLLVSPDFKIVHLSEHAGQYLAPPGGEFTSNVFKLVREELRIELRATIHEAREKGEPVRSRPISTEIKGKARTVVLSVRPSLEPRQEGFTLVIFDDHESTRPDLRSRVDEGEPGSIDAEAREAALRELESELSLTKQRLQAVIEEYETGQEEMKASNEELQSSNEELRSALEELETSKEELQSMNEELQTVNQENRHKVEELAQLSGDLQNLMAATEIATLFLDRNLRILRFTPQVEEIFSVRTTDRGRPLSDLTHRLGDSDLIKDAEQVLSTLVPVESEMQDEIGRWYLVRIRPYRSTNDRIEGIVITLVDISTRKEAEEARVESEERYRALVDASAQMVWTTDSEGNVREDSPSWRAFTGQTYDQYKGRGGMDVIHPEDRASAEDDWRGAIETGSPLNTEWRIYHALSGEYRWTSVRAVPLHDPDGPIRGWVGMNIDVTERREAERSLLQLNETLEERVEERARQVQQLASSLTMAEQEERRRISQVLHDDLQQLLYAVEMKMKVLRDELEEVGHDAMMEKIADARSWVRQAIATTQNLTVDLSPPILQNEGLADALQWLKRQMKELHELEVSVDAEHGFYIPNEDLRVLLFQIVRELLFNVKKHSGVKQASISLDDKDGRLVIVVNDAGEGFDVDLLTDTDAAGFGLVHAAERLRLIGGRLAVESTPGGGTRIEVYSPSGYHEADSRPRPR